MLKMKCHEIANPYFWLLVLRVGTNYSITVINKTATSRSTGYCICITYCLLLLLFIFLNAQDEVP